MMNFLKGLFRSKKTGGYLFVDLQPGSKYVLMLPMMGISEVAKERLQEQCRKWGVELIVLRLACNPQKDTMLLRVPAAGETIPAFDTPGTHSGS